LRRRHPALRRRRFFTGEIRRGDWRAAGVSDRSPKAGPFPHTGPVRPGEAGLPPEDRVLSADATRRPTDAPGPAPAPGPGPAPAPGPRPGPGRHPLAGGRAVPAGLRVLLADAGVHSGRPVHGAGAGPRLRDGHRLLHRDELVARDVEVPHPDVSDAAAVA